MAGGKEYVTDVDLRHSLIPDSMIDDLVKTMPVITLENGRKGYDYEKYMESLMAGPTNGANGSHR